MTVKRFFVPWIRKGFSTALSGTPESGHSRAALPIRMSLTGMTGSSGLPVELAGPGDVAGIDPREILRAEPYAGCSEVEPGYFPYVELASTDLPWRFTPVGPSEVALSDPEHPGSNHLGTRLKPWLALVVVDAEHGTVTPPAAGSLPVLVTTGDQLPAPSESWAWAHVQVNLAANDGENFDAELAGALADPSRCITRIMCPRRLAAATRYGAYLVPTFAASKGVIDPAEVGDEPLGDAWGASGDVRLPIYFQWSFSTARSGTFESLARRLRPRAAPAAAAGRDVDTSRPGWGAGAEPGRTTRMQGALRPLRSEEPAPDPTLAEELRAAISSNATELTLLPPIYGQDFRKGITALTGTTGGWLEQLNTDPRRRLAAGLAAWAVAVEQEDLVDEAWQQLAAAGLPTAAKTATRDLAELVTDTLETRQSRASAATPALLRMARRHGPHIHGQSARRASESRALRRLRRSIGRDPAVAFAPKFTRPAYEFLRAIAPEWLLPGAAAIPQDSVVVMTSHAAFAESYLVGLNYALAQELSWRGYPIDRDVTMFTRFWGTADPSGEASLATWAPDSSLGDHLAGADSLVLLIRGPFVSRFPSALIYLARTADDRTEERLPPSFTGRIGADCTIVGFPLTRVQAENPATGEPWRVVLQEAVEHARFGVDDVPDSGVTTLESWQDLNWSQPQLAGGSHVVVAGPLLGLSRAVRAGSQDQATWGLSAGHLASALQQPAFRVRIPLSLWLSPVVE